MRLHFKSKLLGFPKTRLKVTDSGKQSSLLPMEFITTIKYFIVQAPEFYSMKLNVKFYTRSHGLWQNKLDRPCEFVWTLLCILGQTIHLLADFYTLKASKTMNKHLCLSGELKREFKSCLGQIFHFKLGCFSVMVRTHTHDWMKLKTWPRFCPPSLSLSMANINKHQLNLSRWCNFIICL